MPSMSPSPVKRPSIAERSSSTLSLSSSGKQHTTTTQKVHRVGRHSRNVSHGKGLSKLGKINSTTNVTADGRNHARKKSGQTTPGPSPKTPVSPHMKKNSSHVNLTKNTSHGNLRKNHSAKELAAARNVSQGNLKKLGAPLTQKNKKDEQKSGFFELGDRSSGEEDEGEWEDSTTTQSPELSRNHSKASTPLRSRTPNGDHDQRPFTTEASMLKKVTSPPEASLKGNNKSAPNLRDAQFFSSEQKVAEPPLLHNQPRASRAPPAMSTVSAHVKRSDSTRSFTKISHQDAATAPTNVPTVGTASSSSQGVSHFLPSSSVATSRKSIEDASDEEASFMSNYKPQPSESPEKAKMLNKARLSSIPSRTQQRLELQRREIMRAAASPTPTTPGLGLSAGSSASLHSRSGSKGRNRPLTNDPKALRHDYEAGIKQLTVVRRFRNPILESIHRLQDTGTVPSETSSILSSIGGGGNKSRPQSRRGFTNPNSTAPTPKNPMSRSPEDRKSISAHAQHSRTDSRAKVAAAAGAAGAAGAGTPTAPVERGPRVQFQMSRQGSHDDILNSAVASQGSPGDFGEEQDHDDGISPEEALIRRIWESRVVFESDGVQSSS